MPKVGVRELQRDASGVIARVMRTGRPTIVTKHNEPVAAVVAIDPGELEDFVLSNAPEFVRSMREADRALAEGRTRSADAVFAEMAQERAEPKSPASRRAEPEPGRLTPREREILLLLSQGDTNGQIAERLGIKETTVRRHLVHVLEKLEVGSRVMPAS